MRIYRDFVIGGINRSEIWATGNNAEIQFVDGDFGVGSDGITPKRAVNSLTKAINNITGRGGTIYVRPRTTVASALTYYTDTATIPLTKPGMKILGAGADLLNPYGGPSFKVAAAGSPILDIKAAGCLIEGIEFDGTGITDTINVVKASGDGSTSIPNGLVLRNCRFTNGPGHDSGAGSAVLFHRVAHGKVDNCIFFDCLTGFRGTSSGGTMVGLHITNCEFSGAPANRDIDVKITGTSGSAGFLLDSCKFNDGQPAHADGATKLFFSSITALVGMMTNNFFAIDVDNGTGLFATNGTAAVVLAGIFMAGNYGEANTDGEGLITRA